MYFMQLNDNVTRQFKFKIVRFKEGSGRGTAKDGSEWLAYKTSTKRPFRLELMYV